MINVQPYIDQLEELKDYMDFFYRSPVDRKIL